MRAVTQLSDPQFVSRSSTKLPSLHAHWPGQITSTPRMSLLCSAPHNPWVKCWQNMDSSIRARRFIMSMTSEREIINGIWERLRSQRWGEGQRVAALQSPVTRDTRPGVKTWSENSDNSDQAESRRASRHAQPAAEQAAKCHPMGSVRDWSWVWSGYPSLDDSVCCSAGVWSHLT